MPCFVREWFVGKLQTRRNKNKNRACECWFLFFAQITDSDSEKRRDLFTNATSTPRNSTNTLKIVNGRGANTSPPWAKEQIARVRESEEAVKTNFFFWLAWLNSILIIIIRTYYHEENRWGGRRKRACRHFTHTFSYIFTNVDTGVTSTRKKNVDFIVSRTGLGDTGVHGHGALGPSLPPFNVAWGTVQ